MPAGYLHELCARRAAGRAGLSPRKMDVIILGAQGPDPLFALGIFPLRPSSRPAPYGNLLHTYRTGAFLRALCRLAKASGDPAQQAYALGFLTHNALDSTVHPYVYAHSERADGRYSSSLHMALEKDWDIRYYRQEGNATGTPVWLPCATQTRADWQAIAALWAQAMREVYPEQDVSERTLLDALAGAEKINRLTHSARGIKYAIIWALERLIGRPGLATSQMIPVRPAKEDTTNAAHAPWHSPFDPEAERTEGLTELYEAATARAAELLKAADRYFAGEMDDDALAVIIGDRGYDTGLESKA